MNTYHIHINGIVQGVGFRPMVYQVATEMQLNGNVKNGSDGVHVFINTTEEEAKTFFKKIMLSAPANSKIISSKLKRTIDQWFSNFSILVDENDWSEKKMLIPPDVALCDNCREELYDINNRRYRYPFITCTQCGPRYSIMQSIPYDRANTSMEYFGMCSECSAEYKNEADRRFFSQTNSCTDCGIQMSISDNSHHHFSENTEVVLGYIKNFLEHGKILAVKGIGGYLILCDASNARVIQLLRKRKYRPAKPFAVLYSSIDVIKKDFEVNTHEAGLLESCEAPIVLLYPRQNASKHICIEDIAPSLKRVGVMLPYSPLLDLIAKDFGKPVIATSGNISGSPIIYKEEDVHEYLFQIADYIVDYNRDIIIPEDDSVVQVSKYTHQQIVLRRSRGYAPSLLQYTPKNSVCVLSAGAFLKSSFTLSVKGNVFVSQFLGSGESYESQQMYKSTLQHWLELYQVRPEIVVADRHHGYFSHQLAVETAEKYESEIRLVQHHEAHFAAVIAENDLLHSDKPVLGVIWDGTGLGVDGNIWGGEFFKYENNEMLRCCHFDYFPAIAGDKMAREPGMSALCATAGVLHKPTWIKEKFSETEWNNYGSLIQSARLLTSSVGRIFDAVASLLNICDKQSYEGEAAMYLQSLAEEYIDKNGFAIADSYFKEGSHFHGIPTFSLMQGILQDIKLDKPVNYIAAKFHYSLVKLIDIVAKYFRIQKICFSGGVFQNALLVDWIKNEYSNKYQLFFHKCLSTNDENISFGQLVYYDNAIRTKSKIETRAIDYEIKEEIS